METQERKEVQTTIAVIHEVADFEKWHAVYLEKSNPSARIGVLRNLDNPNNLFVGETTESHAAAKEFFGSEDLKATMQASGVISAPEIRYLNLVDFGPARTESKYRVSVTHEVADFEAWKVIFDTDNERREAAGLTVTGLGTSEDNPAEVFMMLAADDLDAAKAVFNDPKLKDMMQEAGVTSAPEFNYWKMF